MNVKSDFIRIFASDSRSLMPMCIVGRVQRRTAKTVHAEPREADSSDDADRGGQHRMS